MRWAAKSAQPIESNMQNRLEIEGRKTSKVAAPSNTGFTGKFMSNFHLINGVKKFLFNTGVGNRHKEVRSTIASHENYGLPYVNRFRRNAWLKQ